MRVRFRPFLLAACTVAWLTGPAVFAQPPASPAGAALQCAFQRQGHPDYVMWICNPEGSAYARDGMVLWTRTNEAGARITSPVWTGPAKELAKRGEAIIEAHQASQARCVRYVHVARAQPSAAGWNVVPNSMRSWLLGEGSRRFPHFCYASDPGAADVVIVWGGAADRLPNAFTVTIPWDASARPQAGSPRQPAGLAMTAAPDPASLKLAAYEVRAGMDDTVIRLGLSVYAAEIAATPGQRANWSGALDAALQALVPRSPK